MTHIDLFTGIGGFALAASWTGFGTVVMCESDSHRRNFLERAWPGVPIIPDVRKFDGRRWTGCTLLTGGVPCQPASRAGKQRGSGDDRWLWPEALRIVSEARPSWCLFENPPGIYDVGLDGILSELEGLDYEVGTVEIPACAVGSPQRRQRVWIVAHSDKRGLEDRQGCGSHVSGGNHKGRDATDNSTEAEDTGACRCMAHHQGIGRGEAEWGTSGGCGYNSECAEDSYVADPKVDTKRAGVHGPWSNFVWIPCGDGKFRRAPTRPIRLAHGVSRHLLAALGDSIVPQVAAEIMRAIRQQIQEEAKP